MIIRKKDLTWFLDEVHEARKNKKINIVTMAIAVALLVAGTVTSLILCFRDK